MTNKMISSNCLLCPARHRPHSFEQRSILLTVIHVGISSKNRFFRLLHNIFASSSSVIRCDETRGVKRVNFFASKFVHLYQDLGIRMLHIVLPRPFIGVRNSIIHENQKWVSRCRGFFHIFGDFLKNALNLHALLSKEHVPSIPSEDNFRPKGVWFPEKITGGFFLWRYRWRD